MLYFIEAVGIETVGSDHIKIGFSGQSFAKRLAKFQTGNSFPLRVLGTMEGRKSDERRLHERFSRSLVRGEWFKPNPMLLELIRTRTKEFPIIESVDRLFGKKITRYSIHALPESNDLFNWNGLVQEVCRRLGEGQSAEDLAAAARLEVNAACQYFGWVRVRKKWRHQRLHHLLFEREHRLFRYSGYFPFFIVPKNVRESLRSVFSVRVNDFRSFYHALWQRAATEWLCGARRLYL